MAVMATKCQGSSNEGKLKGCFTLRVNFVDEKFLNISKPDAGENSGWSPSRFGQVNHKYAKKIKRIGKKTVVLL